MKRAVLFGCNYKQADGGDYALNGCINDVRAMSQWLRTRNYTSIEMIVDDGSTPLAPTRAVIVTKLQQLVAISKPGDTVFVHYSGHGGQSFETPEDEADGVDETIYGSGEHLEEITDDVLRATLVDAMPRGVKVRCVFDSCHSASVLDLPLRCISGEKFIEESTMSKGTEDVVEISGCLDEQTSADAFIAGKAQGALTWAFLSSIRSTPGASWIQLLGSIRQRLQGKYEQIPQLSVGSQALANSPVDV